MPSLSTLRGRAARFWPLVSVVFLADCTTKRLAQEHLARPGVPHRVLGDAFRLTLTYNDGGALGIDIGPWGLNLLIIASVGLIVGLAVLYRSLPPDARLRPGALGLLMGGALGNLFDRVNSEHRVVDFLDLGVGSVRFWTFNVADVAIFSGAVLLGWWYWKNSGAGEAGPS